MMLISIIPDISHESSMARPRKTGLDYFPLDTTLDREVEMLQVAHGAMGFAVLIHAWMEMYKTPDGCLDISSVLQRKTMAKSAYVQDIEWEAVITTCIEVGLFDKDAYNSGILSSNGVRKRLEKVTEERKRGRDRNTTGYPPQNPGKTVESKRKSKVSKKDTREAKPTVADVDECLAAIPFTGEYDTPQVREAMRERIVARGVLIVQSGGRDKIPKRPWPEFFRAWFLRWTAPDKPNRLTPAQFIYEVERANEKPWDDLHPEPARSDSSVRAAPRPMTHQEAENRAAHDRIKNWQQYYERVWCDNKPYYRLPEQRGADLPPGFSFTR